MSDLKAIIQRALQQAGVTDNILALQNLSGGSSRNVQAAVCDGGKTYVAKITSQSQRGVFDEEATGLRAIAETKTVMSPIVLGVESIDDHAVFVQEYVERGSPTTETWKRFGEQLPALHQSDVGEQYGFDIDNHCGPTLQPNEWSADWVEFNRKNRIGHQLELARKHNRVDRNQADRIAALNERLDEFIPRTPHPSLLHGDLWSGNAMPSADGEVYVIDPAPYIGDGWADIAMMRLFGGFPNTCLDTYCGAIQDHENVDQRIAVYQLYHLLNHVNIFGCGYVEQAMSIVGRLGF